MEAKNAHTSSESSDGRSQGPSERALAAGRDAHHSHPQRITRSPLSKIGSRVRRAGRLVRKIFPLVGRGRYALEPVVFRSLEADGNRYVINGPTPTLDLEFKDSDVELNGITPGLYCFDAKVQTPKGTLFFFLYLGRRDGSVKGFSETDRFLLSFDSFRGTRQMVQIPEGIHYLRLQVYDFDGEFSIANVALRHLGSLNVGSIVFSNFIRPLLSDPGLLLGKMRKAYHVFREGGLVAVKSKLFGGRVNDNYNDWVAQFDTFAEGDLALIREASDALASRPKISVVTPVFNPPIHHFRLCLDSVLNQGYQNWELCLADDRSTDPEVKKVIEEYCAKDSRIKAVFRESSGHISAATNSALSIATGEYVAFLDHDDELTPDALYLVARELNEHPNAKLVYSDEDKKTSQGKRVNPHFKSDWNPELLVHQNYICHLLVIMRTEIEKVGGLRTGFDGAQDWDLILRVSGNLSEGEIRHIPHVLYHWTIIANSTAQSTASKPYALEAQRRAVQEHLDRTGQPGKASVWQAISHIAVDRAVPAKAPKVSLVILTRDKVSLLKQCIETLLKKTSYQNIEIVVVDNGSVEEETFNYFGKIKERPNVKVVRDERPFNFSALNNVGVKHCTGEILGFLNNDLEFVSPVWLEKMVAHAVKGDVGAVGARLLFPNNLLQHGGVILGIGGVAGHSHKGRLKEEAGYFNRAKLSQNMSAVTAACLVMRRDVFERINGFDESLSVAFNDVDLCLRIRAAGFRIVYEPQAELYHHESASRGYENTSEKFARFEREVDLMKKRWGETLRRDPYYNPNLTNLSEDFVLAFPPRCKRAWKRG